MNPRLESMLKNGSSTVGVAGELGLMLPKLTGIRWDAFDGEMLAGSCWISFPPPSDEGASAPRWRSMPATALLSATANSRC